MITYYWELLLDCFSQNLFHRYRQQVFKSAINDFRDIDLLKMLSEEIVVYELYVMWGCISMCLVFFRPRSCRSIRYTVYAIRFALRHRRHSSDVAWK